MTKEKFYEIIDHIGECIKGSIYENCLYAVGGCIRDLTMGNEIKDIDMCIEMPDGGIKFAEWMQENGFTKGSVVTYPTYGTAMFRLKKFPNEEIECVQTRGEQYHDKNSRNPQVQYSTLKEDCFRRDLTMNALYMRVCDHEILDLTGKGIQDIKDTVARVTNDNPDVVFEDDPLRILRVIRFAVKYNLYIDDDTSKSMKKNGDRLSIITRERITDEFSKMMVSPDPARALDLMRYYGVMKYVVPEVEKMVGLEQNKYHFGDAWSHTSKVVNNLAWNSPIKVSEEWLLPVRIAGLLHDVGKIETKTIDDNGNVHFFQHENVGAEMAKKIMVEMRYSTNETKMVEFLIKNHMRTKSWGDNADKAKQKSLNKLAYECKNFKALEALMCLIDADNMAHKQEMCIKGQGVAVLSKVKNSIASKMFGYKLPINGDDVCRIIGIEPSPQVKLYLQHCLGLAFNNPDITLEECEHHIKKDKIKGLKDA